MSKQNHCAFGVIEVDAGDARRHEFLAFLADQSVDGGLTLSVTGNVFPQTDWHGLGCPLLAEQL
jgi:hypothetical protein